MKINKPGENNLSEQEKRELFNKIKDKAFRLLARREHSRFELYRKLTRKKFPLHLVNQVLDYLEEQNYLNDRRFAENWIKSRLRHKPRGPYLIKKELGQKGVDSSIQKELISSLVNPEVEYKLAKQLGDKWLNRKRNEKNIQDKMYRYLLNKGFSSSICKSIIEEYQ